MDSILLLGIKVPCTIGTHVWEQQITQTLIIDLILHTDFSAAGRSDAIKDTIDYTAITSSILAFAADNPHQLLEAFGARLADHLLAQFAIPQLTLKIHKPGAIKGVQDVAIELTRGNNT